MRTHRILIAWLFASTLVGCATAGPPSGSASTSASARAAPAVRRNSSTLSREEILAANQTNALDVIRTLRPHWLRTRGSASITRPEVIKVYQDGIPLGGPGALSQLPASIISSITFLDAASATQRFGTDHANGAILVVTGRGG